MVTGKVFPHEQFTDGRKKLYLPEILERNNYLLFTRNKKQNMKKTLKKCHHSFQLK